MTDQNPAKPSGVSAKHVHIVGAVICALLAAVAWWLGIGPAIATQSQARTQQSAITEREAQARVLQNRIAQLERRISQIRREERQSPLRLESIGHINQRLSDLSDLAAESGLDVEMIKPGGVMARQRFQVLPIQLGGYGHFKDCAMFLHDVNRMFPDTGVASVDVQRQLHGTTGQAKFAFTLIWYASPDEPPLRSVGVETGLP